MAVLLQVNVRWEGSEDEATGSSEEAHAIAGLDGLLWKIWLRDAESKTSAGVYLFADRAAAEAWVAQMTPPVLAAPEASDLRTTIFEIDEAQSVITHAPLGRPAVTV
jgi:hypothetical protein